MGWSDYFRPVSTWTPGQVADHIRENAVDTYHLIDVRQPGEYEEGHLPGARLIPVGELRSRVRELDPGKPAITY
ncbi:MAG TPA: rhodanese-like domain-containing protein [Candidatus Aquicultoraceae bacterium]|jgi:rhodanese-related sulfurtransferase|nr:rhodanese-like domain-containing protein [Candidatus Aquicultoraceae bacterium]